MYVVFEKSALPYLNLAFLDYRWKYEFTKEIFSNVTERTLTAEAPQYQTVLELDRKVREKTLPPHLNNMSPDDEHCTPSMYMRGCLLSQFRSVSKWQSRLHPCIFSEFR